MNSRRPTSHNPLRGLASACIDEDDSGTYDPKEESRVKHASSQPRRTKKAKTNADGEDDASPRSETREGGGAEYSLPVTLGLSSGESVESLKSITPGIFEDDVSSSSDSDSESVGTEDGVLSTRRKSYKPARLGKREARYVNISRGFSKSNNILERMG